MEKLKEKEKLIERINLIHDLVNESMRLILKIRDSLPERSLSSKYCDFLYDYYIKNYFNEGKFFYYGRLIQLDDIKNINNVIDIFSIIIDSNKENLKYIENNILNYNE